MSLDLLAPEIDKLPENWRIKKLGQIAKTYAGGTPLRSNPLYYNNGNIPWVKSGEVDNPNIYETEESVTELAIKETATRFIEKNSVLIALYGATAGKVGRLRVRACSNQAVLAVNTIDENADNDFIYYYLKLSAEALIKMSQGSGQPNLSKGIIDKLLIKFPPLPEQQKIAEILSTVDEKIEAIDQRIAETQELKKGLMQQLLTKGIGHTKFKDSPLGEIPESWEVVISSEIFELIHGYQFREYDFTDIGLPVVKIGQINSQGEIDMTNCSYFSEDRAEEFRDKIIFNGDVLMALTGATLGKSCWVSGLESNVYQNYRVGKFEPRDENILSKRYLYFLIGSPLVLNQIFAKVNSGAQGNIGKADFEKLKITLPSIAEQNRISEILSTVDKKLQIQQDKKAEYQELKKGLMQQLLTGKIRVKTT